MLKCNYQHGRDHRPYGQRLQEPDGRFADHRLAQADLRVCDQNSHPEKASS